MLTPVDEATGLLNAAGMAALRITEPTTECTLTEMTEAVLDANQAGGWHVIAEPGFQRLDSKLYQDKFSNCLILANGSSCNPPILSV